MLSICSKLAILVLSLAMHAWSMDLVMNQTSDSTDAVDKLSDGLIDTLLGQVFHKTVSSNYVPSRTASFPDFAFHRFENQPHFHIASTSSQHMRVAASARLRPLEHNEGTYGYFFKEDAHAILPRIDTALGSPSTEDPFAKHIRQTKCLLQRCPLQLGKCVILDTQCRGFVVCLRMHCTPDGLARAGYKKQIDIDACNARCQMATIQYPENMVFADLTACMLEEQCIESIENNLPVSQDMWTLERIPSEALVTWSGGTGSHGKPHPDYIANIRHSTARGFDPVQAFAGNELGGKTWYITRGLHPIFDLLRNQQFHCTGSMDGSVDLTMDFDVPEKFPWGDEPTARIMKHQRVSNQKLIPTRGNSAHLKLIVTEDYSARDDWLVIGANVIGRDESDYIFIVHMGSNDAWKGYGGAFLLTPTTRQLRPELEIHLNELAKRANIDWMSMKEPINDNMASGNGLQAVSR